MNSVAHTSSFRPAVVAAALTVAAAACLAVGLVSTDAPGDQLGVAFGVGSVWLLALASLPVLQVGLRQNAQQAAALYMATTGGRMLLVLVLGLLGVLVLHLSVRPTLLALAGSYLPLLAVEVVFVYRATLPPAPAPAPGSSTGSGDGGGPAREMARALENGTRGAAPLTESQA